MSETLLPVAIFALAGAAIDTARIAAAVKDIFVNVMFVLLF